MLQVNAMLDAHEGGPSVKAEIVAHASAPPASSGRPTAPPRFPKAAVQATEALKTKLETPSPGAPTPGHMHARDTSTSTPVLQLPAQAASATSPGYLLRRQPATSGASAHNARRPSSRTTPVPSCSHQSDAIATAITPVLTSSHGGQAKSAKASAKPKLCASVEAENPSDATAAAAHGDGEAGAGANDVQRHQQDTKPGIDIAATPAVPHGAAVTAVRLIASFTHSQRIIRKLVTELHSDVQPDERLTAHACTDNARARTLHSTRNTPAAAAAGPCSAAKPGGLLSQQGQTPQMRRQAGSRAPVDAAGGRADATANLLLAGACRTPTAPASDHQQRPQAGIRSQRLRGALDDVQLHQTQLMARLHKVAAGRLIADSTYRGAEKPKSEGAAWEGALRRQQRRKRGDSADQQSPASVAACGPSAWGGARSRRAAIAAELISTFTSTQLDVLTFFEVRFQAVTPCVHGVL